MHFTCTYVSLKTEQRMIMYVRTHEYFQSYIASERLKLFFKVIATLAKPLKIICIFKFHVISAVIKKIKDRRDLNDPFVDVLNNNSLFWAWCNMEGVYIKHDRFTKICAKGNE